MSLGRVLLVSLAVLAVGFGMWRYWWTALDHFPEQDACSFGLVTNAEYRQMLARVKVLQAEGKGVWAPLRGPTRSDTVASPTNPPGVPEQLAARMNELSGDTTSLYVRQAVMHAVMRAAGAYLHNSRLFGLNDFSRDLAENRTPTNFISAEYMMHSNYRGDFLGMLLLAPFGKFHTRLNGEYGEGLREPEWWRPNQFRVSGTAFYVIGRFLSILAVMPTPAGGYFPSMPPGESCLFEPDPRVVNLYTKWARTRQSP
jgi:hypothetical protein